MGLGQSFRDGALRALELGADILVNTDGDNQYPSERIPDLVRPILDGEVDIVVGDRQTHTIAHFSPLKKRLQRVGSGVVNLAAGTDIPDAAVRLPAPIPGRRSCASTRSTGSATAPRR